MNLLLLLHILQNRNRFNTFSNRNTCANHAGTIKYTNANSYIDSDPRTNTNYSGIWFRNTKSRN